MEIRKTYAEITSILTNNNLYFNYEDTPIGPNGYGTRTIITTRGSDVTYLCEILIKSVAEAGSDQEDFDNNWAAKAGEKRYVYYSHTFNVTSDGFQFDFKIKANDETTDVESFVYKGLIAVDENAVRGDWIEVAVVDKDNILGYGANTILGYMIRKKYLHGGKQDHFINPPKYDFLSSKRKVFAGLYVRITYHGTGRPNVIADYEYEY